MKEPGPVKGEQVDLPEPFVDLQRFDAWALPTEAARNRKRLSSSFAELTAFYDASIGHIHAMLAHLDQYDVAALGERERRLYWLTLALMEVSISVEVTRSVDLHDAVPPERLDIRDPAYRAGAA